MVGTGAFDARRGRRLAAGLPLALFALLVPAAAQQSASFRLEEHTLNSGGHPERGIVLSSSGFRMSLDAIGDGFVARGLAGASHGVDAGFVAAYPPPGEVKGLGFEDKTTLRWDADRAAGTYNLYRDLLGNLAGLGYGTCWQQGLAASTATDGEAVPPGNGFFYLATVENRLAEEGTKGRRSDDIERAGTTCP